MTQPGHLDIEGCLNFRDTGGWPTDDGRTTRLGVLYRADDSTRITDRGRAAVADLDLALIVDLRQNAQFARGAHFGDMAITYHCPLVDRVINLDAPVAMENPADMAALYVDMLGRSIEPFASAIDRIAADLSSGPALIHCVYGKDRTGLLVAAIQAAIGVRREAIVAEYARSNQPTQARYQMMLAAPIAGDAKLGSAPPFLFNAPADTMSLLLDHLEREHGSLLAWVQALPLQADTIDRLRAALLSAGQ